MSKLYEAFKDLAAAHDEMLSGAFVQSALDRRFTVADAIAEAVDAERRRCAWIARNGCLVPPDGGSPTEAEAALCEEIARRILAR